VSKGLRGCGRCQGRFVMRCHGRFSDLASWVFVLALSAAGLVLASCGGSINADAAMDAAEEALPMAELWDPQTGEAAAQPVSSETLDAAAFDSFAKADPDRAAHLQMAAEMGYATVLAAGRVTYDNGAVMTTAALAGGQGGDIVMLVVGAMPGDSTTPDPPESIFIAKPVSENGELVRIELTSEKGALSLDLATGEVDLAEAEYGSCAAWNCLAGAVYFWWEDNMTDVDNPYMRLMGEVCMNCIVLPGTQEVTCPACAVLIGAPVLASVADCTIWPCNLCVSDACHAPEYGNQRCVTENGVGSVRRSVTPWVCENPKTQEAECVQGTTVTEIESCPWGCRPGTYICNFPTQCLVGAPYACGTGTPTQTFCLHGDAMGVYQKYACVSTDPNAGGVWGECVALTGQFETRTTPCPYTCAGGECQLPPTCDPTICDRLERPLGEAFCTVRPDDGVSVIVQPIEPHGCETVEPHVPAPGWPEGQSCQALDPTLRAIETCQYGCAPGGVSCATEPLCSASGLSPVPVAEDLPAAVAGIRRQIIEAAVACDYEALAALASSGSYFAYSLDETGDPVEYWRSLEESGGEPLRWMVTTLNLPAVPAGVGGQEGAFYLWSDGPGGVTNYRTGISTNSQWLFFLPDD
jgi:hypothetical protein